MENDRGRQKCMRRKSGKCNSGKMYDYMTQGKVIFIELTLN